MSYLYSKLPETGVSPHIDTGGPHSHNTSRGIRIVRRYERAIRIDRQCFLIVIAAITLYLPTGRQQAASGGT